MLPYILTTNTIIIKAGVSLVELPEFWELLNPLTPTLAVLDDK